ncbi:hypothetical protein KMZ14_05015 [Acinetobacter schindleri]|uniref:hypothetical protein n=1 Tax=Acinetobacter schindleri TaxID=108981 RepID=UPI002361CE38|nr:hypothetical protein [Acinetobacter schindleri]WDE16909.1 hypothetical protein KMZ14_05015 [Acinetobacter schindleri]
MKSMTHIAPLLNVLFKNGILLGGFAPGRKLLYFNYCAKATPELNWDITTDFPFDPKRIPKIKYRKIRKAAYQSFTLYKTSFKSRPKLKPKLKVIADEWGKALSKLAKAGSDAVDAFSYAFASLSIRSKQDFEKQYLCTWDLASDYTEDKSAFMDV